MFRSLLFVPGDSERKLDKAPGTAADLLIVDLEDAVAAANKEAALGVTRAFLNRDRAGKQVYVRVNAFDTGWVERDLAAVMAGKPDGIVLPKSEGGGDIDRLAALLDRYDDGATRIIPVATETPHAVLNLASYRDCGPRLAGLMWGAEDLASAIGATSNRDADGRFRSPFRLARDLCLHAAASAGVAAIDTVYVDVHNHEGLRAEALEARADGFTAKAVIHPAHCEIVNAAFAATEAEIAWANAVLDALVASSGGGVAMLDGKMLDKPHEVQARRILASLA